MVNSWQMGLLCKMCIFGYCKSSEKLFIMSILIDIKELPVEEKAAILLDLQEDVELNQYLHLQSFPLAAMEELQKRDKAFREGKEPTTTWESVKSRLQEIKNEL
jgi:hypothetical protein